MWKHLSNLQKASLFTTLVFIFVFLIIVLPIKLGTSFVMFIPLAFILITMLLTSEAFTKSGWKQLGFHRYFHLDYQEKESKRVALKLTYDLLFSEKEGRK